MSIWKYIMQQLHVYPRATDDIQAECHKKKDHDCAQLISFRKKWVYERGRWGQVGGRRGSEKEQLLMRQSGKKVKSCLRCLFCQSFYST